MNKYLKALDRIQELYDYCLDRYDDEDEWIYGGWKCFEEHWHQFCSRRLEGVVEVAIVDPEITNDDFMIINTRKIRRRER